MKRLYPIRRYELSPGCRTAVTCRIPYDHYNEIVIFPDRYNIDTTSLDRVTNTVTVVLIGDCYRKLYRDDAVALISRV